MIVCDASFISLAKVLDKALDFARPGGRLIALIKPQFEAGRAALKRGIVRDTAVHAAVCQDISNFVAALGWRILGIVPSPISGGDGNTEFLIGAVHD
jgi:23S rRNA (cytidine1920-2'-O)/16S rRNA (cytidine1409-2'-O)-methyltransferase